MLSALQISLVSGLVASVVATPWDLEKRGCGNNCARAVIASAFPNRPTAADCSSYFGATVTPSTVTIFETVTGTQTASLTLTDTITNTQTDFETQTATATVASTTTKPYVAGRDVSVKTIPTYATACANVAAYQEACGCIGVTPYTVTLPAPLTTVQVPATNTLTNTILETNTQSATIVETLQTTATITNVATVTAGPPTCVVPLPVSCTTLAGKTGVALVIQLGVCIAKLIPIYPTVSQNVKTAATTCLAGTNGNSNAANIQACLKAAFQCPA